MRGLHQLLLLYGCLRLIHGHVGPCNVSEDARGILYRVPEIDASLCYYSWSNETHYVLANNEVEISSLVVMKSHNTLLLRTCLDVIFYWTDCVSKGSPHTLTCNASCRQEFPGTKPTDFDTGDFTKTQWTLIYAAVSIGLLLLLLGPLVMLRYHRNRVPICFYSAVKEPDAPQRRNSMEGNVAFSAVRDEHVLVPLSACSFGSHEKKNVHSEAPT